MTTLLEASRQALEALELYPVTVNHWKTVLLPAAQALRQAIEQAEQPAQHDIPDLIAGALGVSRGTAYDLMREALTEQAQPVAWMCSDESLLNKGYLRFSRDCQGAWNIPVYTFPPPRKALEWRPIDTAPENMDERVLVTWVDETGSTRFDLDYTEDGCWIQWHEHAEHTEIIGGHGVSYTPPYIYWMPLQTPPIEHAEQAQPVANGKLKVTLQDTPTEIELAQYKRMFEAACSALGAIGEALGVDEDEGGAEPILAAIEKLKASTPPRQPWVGLTDEEIERLVDDEDWYNDPHGFARAIEAAHGITKEKNA